MVKVELSELVNSQTNYSKSIKLEESKYVDAEIDFEVRMIDYLSLYEDGVKLYLSKTKCKKKINKINKINKNKKNSKIIK